MNQPLAVAAALAVLVAGCGGGGEKTRPRTLEAVRTCLHEAEIDVRGGRYDRPADDKDAPDGELVTQNMTFIAFYASEARADKLAAGLRARAEELGGTTTRHGTITVLYTALPEVGTTGKTDPRIEGCVEG